MDTRKLFGIFDRMTRAKSSFNSSSSSSQLFIQKPFDFNPFPPTFLKVDLNLLNVVHKKVINYPSEIDSPKHVILTDSESENDFAFVKTDHIVD